MPSRPKLVVYVLQSRCDPTRRYVGRTSDLEYRLVAHNAGHVKHTAKHRPWTVIVAIAFSDTDRALRFEQYLKSGSGRAFTKRHFL